MSDYVIEDPEIEIECPYDKAHMVRKKRMQYHLIKCRRNHAASKKEFATCPYNATHEMPKPELRHHMMVCPDKAIVEKTIRYEEAKRVENGPMLKGCTDVPSYDTYEIPESENWDLEVPSVPRMGVDPSFFNGNTRRCIAGLSPLEKRQFHSSLIPDMNDYNIDDSGPYIPVGMSVPDKPAKSRTQIRAPKAKSQAETLYQEQKQQEVRQPKAPSTVFQYSLAMAGVGRGRGILSNAPPAGPGSNTVQPLPGNLQAYALNNKQPSVNIPPASIRDFILVNGKKTSSKSSSSASNCADNPPNDAFSDDEDFDGVETKTIKTTPVEPTASAANGIQNYILPKRTAGRGRGIRRQNENEVYKPQMTKPSVVPALGRGARLQNGYVEPPLPTNPNGWASLVSADPQPKLSSGPPPGFTENDRSNNANNMMNDFPSLYQSSTNSMYNNNNNNTKDGSLNQYSTGGNTPDEWLNGESMIRTENTEDSNEILENAKKQSKNLRRKLASIAKLEEKKKKGGKLSPDEVSKISKKAQFEEELAKLTISA